MIKGNTQFFFLDRYFLKVTFEIILYAVIKQNLFYLAAKVKFTKMSTPQNKVRFVVNTDKVEH